VLPSLGALYLNYEEDLRGGYRFHSDEIYGEINSIGGSLRQVFADSKGDRVILYLQAEAEHNFQENMVHQAYVRYKGPMGKWNITVGRIPLQWGLVTDWTPERMPYTSPYKVSGILKNDNGILLSGTVGMVDYGISLTQGFGMSRPVSFPGPGLVTGRVGVSPLLGGELVVGLSGSYGTSYRSVGHHGDEATPVDHLSGALDLTAYIGRGTVRMESGAERVHSEWTQRNFLSAEYQLLPKLTLIGSGNLLLGDDEKVGTIFAGAATKIKSVTIRGGYEYEKSEQDKQTVVVQLYRQFAFNR